MDLEYIQHTARKLILSVKQVSNIFQLHAEGSTIPFIARYRKEATGNLDEVIISNVVEEIKYFQELKKRKETILKTIESQGKLSPALQLRIEDCMDATALEDIYLPYKPKRKTRATVAMEKGLEPLARLIFDQEGGDPGNYAAAYIGEKVKDTGEALQGARDIIAEWITENELARSRIRKMFDNGAVISSRAVPAKKETADAQKYRDYFEYTEPLRTCPSHRLLAIRRGEKEGFLLMDIHIEKARALETLERLLVKSNGPEGIQVKLAIDDSFDRLLNPSIENEYRIISKNKADEQAIGVFAENLRQLLLSSPLGSKRVLALDPGFKSGCKLVCLDEHGNLLYYTTIYPHPPQNEIAQSTKTLQALVVAHYVEAIAIGNGTAGRETEQWARSIDFGKHVAVFMVNESGASIYSASEVAREEFPEQDITVRGSVSIGRRLLDPLSELVKIDPKSIGVGQYQHDVNPNKLKEELDRVVESCVNHVGVNVNTAGRHLLMYVSGLSASLAKNMIDYRTRNGPFKTREEFKKVGLMGPKSFEQSAAFLRILNAANPLDNSSVHPESYRIVEAMAADQACAVPDLVRQPELRRQINKQKYISETAGAFTIDDIVKELEKPGRDPRTPATEFSFDERIRSMEDLKEGMTVPGIITNITNFGVFVDIGVKQDGLIHISQLSDTFVSDPNQVVKLQQQVSVTVTAVDIARKRISLSMKTQGQSIMPREQPASHQKIKTHPAKPAIAKTPPPPQKSFESSLDELKKKFRG